MKKALINYIKQAKHDQFYTPPEAVFPILKYLPKDKIYWECTDCGNSSITKVLKERGFNVVSTHINNGFDFLRDTPNFNFDIIITNPPYSLKTEFIRRAYSFGKPFLFLLPLTSLEGKSRGKLFRENGLQLIVLDSRINFMADKKNVWFNTSWFCWKLLPSNLIFERVIKKQK